MTQIVGRVTLLDDAAYPMMPFFTGGLIGPPGTRWEYGGSFDGTPVFLGTSDVDEFVPEERVRESAGIFEGMGANVTLRVYPGMDHVVNDEEIAAARKVLREVASGKEAGSWAKP